LPRVTSVSVMSGPAAGGTSVTITGTGFTGTTAVTFGSTPAASFMESGDTSITAISPAASGGTVDITVTTAGGTSVAGSNDQFTFVAVPIVSGISPDNGPLNGGTLVTITGANFVDVATVSFGETPAGFTVNDDTSITALSPPGEDVDTVDITVVNLGGTSARTPADKFSYTPAVAVPICGDGTLDPGEQCDDGAANGAPGDCCTVTCTFQAEGTDCTDDGNLCTADVCDGAGLCIHPAAPAMACTPPDLAAGASLLVRATSSGRSQVEFQWAKGPVVMLGDFGDPTSGEVLQLCIYGQTGPGAYALAFSGSPSASDGGAWTGTATRWKFKSATGAPDGITNAKLTGSTIPLKAKIQVKAVNSPALAPLPWPATPSVVVQFQTSLGGCWGATFSMPSENTPTKFKATSD